MKENIDRDDWIACILVGIGLLATAIGNYIYHGGHIVW
jgi:NADH/NAD ratio-sensing transcriptional regulator Rex